MSVHRENITWQSKDGTWNLGFWDYFELNTNDPDRDFEWDVEYDYSAFNWVSTGHRSAEAADASWNGANPGCGNVVEYSPATAKSCDAMDAKAKAFKESRRGRR